MLRNSLKNKLALAIIVTILAFGILATYLVFIYAKNEIISNEKSNLELTTIEQSDENKQIFFNSQNIVKSIAESLDVQEYMGGEQVLQDKHILQHLNLLNIGDQYSAMYLMNSEGLTVASTNESFVGKNYSFREYFQRSMLGQDYVDVAVGVTSHQLGYYFSHPIKSETGEIIGVAIVKMIPDLLHRTLDDSRIAERVDIMLVDEFGVIIHSQQSDRVYKSLGVIGQANIDSIDERRRFDGIDIKPLDYGAVQEILPTLHESAVVELFDEDDGEEEIIVVARIGDLPFFIVVEEEVEEFTAQAVNIAFILAFFVLIAAFFAVIVVYFSLAQFLKPLKKLNSLVGKISAGDLKQKVEVQSSDEIGQLADNINKMSGAIQKSRTDIEKKVAKRTEDLENLNKSMIGRELKMIELKKEINRLKK